MPAITRQAGAVIGAIQEVRYAHKERKLAERGELEGLSPVTSNEKKPGFDKDDDDDDDDDEDDEDWALDDAAAEFEDEGEDPPEYSEAAGDKKVPMDEVFQLFEKAHSRAFNVNPDKETPLPNPVILPQRRPKDKRRGFVRAYAPSLAECKGIDQATFMRFLNDFDKASRVSDIQMTRRYEESIIIRTLLTSFALGLTSLRRRQHCRFGPWRNPQSSQSSDHGSLHCRTIRFQHR